MTEQQQIAHRVAAAAHFPPDCDSFPRVRERIFATAIVPDGYNGHERRAGFAFVRRPTPENPLAGMLVEVYDFGYFRATGVDSERTFSSAEEAIKAIKESPRYSDVQVCLPGGLGI